jgi:single-stranded DNA-binding protein
LGKLRLSEWTFKDGERRSRVQVVADAAQFLGAPSKTKPAESADVPADTPAVDAYPPQGRLIYRTVEVTARVAFHSTPEKRSVRGHALRRSSSGLVCRHAPAGG